jgi:hypothetical protein
MRVPVNVLPIMVDRVPEYEARGDWIVVHHRHLELHIPIQICRKAVGRLNRALDEWHERQDFRA